MTRTCKECQKRNRRDAFAETCRALIGREGECSEVDCDDCPFSKDNNREHSSCDTAGYAGCNGSFKPDPVLVESAQNWLRANGYEVPEAVQEFVDLEVYRRVDRYRLDKHPHYPPHTMAPSLPGFIGFLYEDGEPLSLMPIRYYNEAGTQWERKHSKRCCVPTVPKYARFLKED